MLKPNVGMVGSVFDSTFQDVSLLLDLCRQTIIFEDLDDLSTCLGSIYDDADVVVLQVCDPLHLNYSMHDSWDLSSPLPYTLR